MEFKHITTPPPNQTETAWSEANSGVEFGNRNHEVNRYDPNGALMERHHFGQTDQRFGWVVAEDEVGKVVAINALFRLPVAARRTINSLRIALSHKI